MHTQIHSHNHRYTHLYIFVTKGVSVGVSRFTENTYIHILYHTCSLHTQTHTYIYFLLLVGGSRHVQWRHLLHKRERKREAGGRGKREKNIDAVNTPKERGRSSPCVWYQYVHILDDATVYMISLLQNRCEHTQEKSVGYQRRKDPTCIHIHMHTLICMSVCVCVCVCVYIHTHKHTHTIAHVHACVQNQRGMHEHMHVCTYTHAWTGACMDARTHARTHARMLSWSSFCRRPNETGQ